MRTGSPQFGNRVAAVQDLRHGDWYRWEGVWRKATQDPDEKVCTGRLEKPGDTDVYVKRASGRTDVISWNTQLQVYREMK